MNFRIALKLAVPLLFVLAVFAATESAKTVTVKGYVLDSACAFTKSLKKPISSECAIACAKNGSPLVILAPSGTIYWPIADATPSSSQNEKLLSFRWTESNSEWQSIPTWRLDGDRHQQDRTAGGSQDQVASRSAGIHEHCP